jgi:hypothetical protein
MDTIEKKKIPRGSRIPIDRKWCLMLFTIAQKGCGHWFDLCLQGRASLFDALYDLYNAKPREDEVPGDFADAISREIEKRKLMKLGQGPFYVCGNLQMASSSDIDWDSEWRVYVNVKCTQAPMVFGKVLDLFANPRCRILQAKINKDIEQARDRSDIIVIYCDSQEGAKATAWCLASDHLVAGCLGRETVCMTTWCRGGISIGESPKAKTGKAEDQISFGDLRSAVLTCAVWAACFELGRHATPQAMFESMCFWIGELIERFGLSAVDSSQNGTISAQPATKGELIARVDSFIQQLGAIARHLN